MTFFDQTFYTDKEKRKIWKGGNKMDELRYETFIRGAFKRALGREIGRFEDPAGLANADYARSDSYLANVKAATSYAMYIYQNQLVEVLNAPLSEEHASRLETLPQDVLNAATVTGVVQYIEEFKSTYSEYLQNR